MGAMQVPDELQRVIERQVEEGRAASVAAFPEEAVRRFIEDAHAEEEEVRGAAQAGAATRERAGTTRWRRRRTAGSCTSA